MPLISSSCSGAFNSCVLANGVYYWWMYCQCLIIYPELCYYFSFKIQLILFYYYSFNQPNIIIKVILHWSMCHLALLKNKHSVFFQGEFPCSSGICSSLYQLNAEVNIPPFLHFVFFCHIESQNDFLLLPCAKSLEPSFSRSTVEIHPWKSISIGPGKRAKYQTLVKIPRQTKKQKLKCALMIISAASSTLLLF